MEIRTRTATLIVTKLDEIPSCTTNMKKSTVALFNSSFVIGIIRRREPSRATKYIDMKTHLTFLTLPLLDLIVEAAILDSIIPPKRHPTR